MKTTNDPVPDMLRLNTETGELYCADGQPVKDYLRNWAKVEKLPAGLPVVLTRRTDFCQLVEDARLAHSWAS